MTFWAIYGHGVGIETMASVATFGAAYMLVVLIEPVVDLAVLAGAKALRGNAGGLIAPRVRSGA